ncbi:Sec63-domain-containing protein [Thelephora ganbajun]|uniref:Sec63-domain-containing protein n=1 Tax=Thelephora ganbajun TaxID=370292 RepID=A0ACB6ZB69_THEGA|nr:Sec63-domain-containing protein [Thelephora ganbajun]
MDFATHVQLLTGVPPAGSSKEEQVLRAWASRKGPGLDDHYDDDDDDYQEVDTVPPHSVLDVYRQEAILGHSCIQGPSVLNKLTAKPNGYFMLDSVRSILSSGRPDDAISGELADLLGLDELELVTDILSNRSQFFEEPNVIDEPTLTLVPLKVKGKEIDMRSLAPDKVRRRMEQQLQANASRPLFTGTAHETPEILPHVYTSHSNTGGGGMLSQYGSKYMLPIGTLREEKEGYEEVIVPPAKVVPPRATERLIPVAELVPLARGSFPNYTTLNRIQSIVFPTAFGSNENMLICAPTGAGKTDVAMLTILRVLDQNRIPSTNPNASIASTIDRNAFKIIYVAPMKALAAEIVRKLGKRLQWLSVRVKELTGDMQMTKAEIAETQIIVTTPEKWDVVTRKPTGEGELATQVRLLIIDEVHLLDEERGAVIETIVARTLRQVESSQSVIRIVGLSATLPNYVDVADFLRVSRYAGLFFFDSSFRPVPLEQHFIGVRGKLNTAQSRKNLDRVTFEKVSELVKLGHQVMVFVHARKETVKAAQALKESATIDGCLDAFSCEDHPSYGIFRRDIGESRNQEMRQLFDFGFGIHHAGMLRSDRNMMERMFEARAIKVLCCTATLAWGVNLPAHAVVIKGTQVYDSSKGQFTDLSILDVLQVFGRAGRPGLESSGEGYICTTEDRLTHYLDKVTSQNPIESKFERGMNDALNAEISLGTVSNVNDAVQWLGYTYLFVRASKNPMAYGMLRDDVAEDPRLGAKRNQLVTNAVRRLVEARMVNWNRSTGALQTTDLGGIAAKYYIRLASIEVFNQRFRPRMSEADVLKMLSYSTEVGFIHPPVSAHSPTLFCIQFNQIQLRESETKELEALEKKVPCEVKDGTMTPQGKVNILLQSYISRYGVEDFALVSDQGYVAQNAGRIIRALFEIALSNKWANASHALASLSKVIERRMWPDVDHPLGQFNLQPQLLHNLSQWADDWMVGDLAVMDADELGKLIRMNEKHGSALKTAAQQFPTVKITYSLRPLGHDILKVPVRVDRLFTWSPKVHGTSEPFWLWIEDAEGPGITQIFNLSFRPTTETVEVDFTLSLPGGQPRSSMVIRWISDTWVGAESEVAVSFESLVMPAYAWNHTPRLDSLPLLHLTAIRNRLVQSAFANRISRFNALQSQVLWSLLHTQLHSLICAPIGCGKSIMTQVLVMKTLHESPDGWVLMISPRRSLVAELEADLRDPSRSLGLRLEICQSNDVFKPGMGKLVRIAPAEVVLDSLAAGGERIASFKQLKLVVLENLDILDADYELAISVLRLRCHGLPVRFVGSSASLNDSADLVAWLQVDNSALHNFRPIDRDQSFTIVTKTFTTPLSSALYKAMAKPAYSTITSHPGQPVIIFVPSRNHCRTVAMDLITECALADLNNIRGFVPPRVDQNELEFRLTKLQDRVLVDFVSKGIGFYHEKIGKKDRALVLQMYIEGIVRVLIVPKHSCWTLPVRAGVVIIMGTQYVVVGEDKSDRQVRDYELEEIIRMQGRAIRPDSDGHLHLFCHPDAKDLFARFLNEGLPLESSLLDRGSLIVDWIQKSRGTDVPIREHAMRQEVHKILSWTFLRHRISSNPVYYNIKRDGGDVLQQAVEKVL